EALRGLQRQAIDQVDVHRAEAGPPAFVDHGGRPGHRLDAVDRALHPLVEVLHTQAGAVETRAGEVRDVARPDVPRVELDGEIRGRAARQAQVPAHALDYGRELRRCEEVRRTAAEMELRHLAIGSEQRQGEVDLGEKPLD